MTRLPQGVPALADYERLVASAELAEMKAFSSTFRGRHPDLVPDDPLDQWSRRWEYPFALDAVRGQWERVGGHGYRVLDAGSGFTFLPFLLSERLGASVTCVDASAALEPAFRRAAADEHDVRFIRGDLTAAGGVGHSSFDAVLCISVLEHVRRRDRAWVLGELHRALRPGGLLVLTFDVGLDGDYEIPLRDAEALLATLGEVFPGEEVTGAGALEAAASGDVLTSRRVAAAEPERMPWSGRLASTLGSLRHGFLPRSFGFRNLTVWCGRLVKGREL